MVTVKVRHVQFGLIINSEDKCTTQARVNIIVTDINDNPPLFLQSQYSLSIREDAPSSTILTLVVTDVDETGTANSQFDIAIASGNEDGLFTISSPNGVLNLTYAFSYVCGVESLYQKELKVFGGYMYST